jgi:hypothetical protein
MPDWTDLNCEIAACWKVPWNVDPAPFSVPLSAAALGDDPPDGLGEEEHAERVLPAPRLHVGYLLWLLLLLLLPE